MSSSFSLAALAILLVATTLCEKTTAETHIVGDNLGWRIPPNPAAYATWASQHTFVAGDVLVFNFTTGQHDVARVTKGSFDACNPSNPISLMTVGPANITLDSAGEQHFFCTFGQHCLAGQKLAINVTASTSPSPPSPAPTPEITPSPSPTPTPVPPPPSLTPTPSPSPAPETPLPSPLTPSLGPSIPPSSPSPATPAPGLLPPSSDGNVFPPPTGGSLIPPPPPDAAAQTAVSSSIFVMLLAAAVGSMF